jgi:hypothetical protein
MTEGVVDLLDSVSGVVSEVETVMRVVSRPLCAPTRLCPSALGPSFRFPAVFAEQGPGRY